MKREELFISPSLDVIFKAMFGREDNKDLLTSLIVSVTDIPESQLEALELVNPELPVDYADEKISRLDLRIRLRDRREIDIEIQLKKMDLFPERSLYYWSKMYGNDFNVGDHYKKLRPCIVINFLGYTSFEGADWHTIFYIIDEKTGRRLTDHLAFHYVELPKHKGYNERQEDETKLMKWVKFLSLSSETELIEMKSKTTDADILKAFEVLEELRKDPAMREEALSREIALRDHLTYVHEAQERGREEGIEIGIEQGREEGIEIGREEGKVESRHEFAEKLKEKGYEIQEISELTGLSIEEIEKL